MSAISRVLQLCARYGRIILVLGLVAGIVFEGLASWLRDYLPELVAGLLFIAALRVGSKQAFGSLHSIGSIIGIVIAYQIATPLFLLFAFKTLGFWGPIALAIVLMASAASIAGSANLVILTGNDPAPALRLLIVGTALLPLTVLPTFFLLPELGSALAVLHASGRLLLLIACAAASAFVVRRFVFPSPSSHTMSAIDGASALAMALVVVGLMSAVGPALRGDLQLFLLTLLAACAANFGLQIIGWLTFRKKSFQNERVAFSIVAGNRNMALFLASLPMSVTDPLLLFIGCYQVPMYLTPIILARLFANKSKA